MVGCFLLATKVAAFCNRDTHFEDIPVAFFPVYSSPNLITANHLNHCSYLPHLSTVSILTRSTKFKDFHGSNRLTHLYIFFILCGNSWDIKTNPGPDSTNGTSHYPCGVCEESVGWEDRGICCDTCNIWYHIDCQGMSTTMYSILNKSSGKGIVWECIKCGIPNFSTTLFDTSTSPDTQNRFDSLSSLSDPESPVPDNISPSTAASSPIVQDRNEARTKTAKAVLNHPLRILIMNCQSIKNKKAELHTIIDSAKPDIILGNESWLTPDIKNSEIFPE